LSLFLIWINSRPLSEKKSLSSRGRKGALARLRQGKTRGS
jgi:hypothetical protein